jgi:hypothetical protein
MINSIYKRGLKYLGMILQRYGLVERTPENEASSLLLRYVRRPRSFLGLEGYCWRDVLLQFAMLLYLVQCSWLQGLTFRQKIKNGTYSLTTPSDEERQFTGIIDVARWATATAFG